MEPLGGAAASIAIFQTAFSLASALNSYASSVHEAEDDILSLASEIESTFGHIRDLGDLIQKNDKTHAWSEDGLKNAQKCVRDCERIIKKLRKLLQKSTASVTSEKVGSGDIDVTKFEKFVWPIYKPRLNVWRKELRGVKQDILIAHSTYMTQAGVTLADRQRALHDLPRIERNRKLIQSQVQKEKETLRQAKLEHRMNVNADSLRQSRPKNSLSDDGPFIYEREEDLVLDFQQWAANIEQQKRQEEEDRKRIEEEALEKWKSKRNEEAEALNQQIRVARTKLREELSRQQIAPQKIEEIIDRIHPEPNTSNDFRVLDSILEAGESNQPAERKGPSRRSIYSRIKFKRTSSPAIISRQERANKIIPALLQDPSAEGEIAHLEACYFQRAKEDGQKIRHFQVGIPQQWLLESLMMKEKQSRNNPKKLTSIWREFAALPDDYREAITNVLTNTEELHSGGDHGWEMIFAECLRQPRHGGFLFRKVDDDVLGVWVVWKKRKHHVPLKFHTLNPYSDPPDATKTLVQANDQTQDTVLDDVTNSNKARIIPNSIDPVGSRTRTEINHGIRERERERERKRRARGRRNENHGNVERELEVGLDASNSDRTIPYHPRRRSVKVDERRRRDTFNRGYTYSNSDSDSIIIIERDPMDRGSSPDKVFIGPSTARSAHRRRSDDIDRGSSPDKDFIKPSTARIAHRRSNDIDRGSSPNEIIIRRPGRRMREGRDSSRSGKSDREFVPEFESYRKTRNSRSTNLTDLSGETVDRGSTLPYYRGTRNSRSTNLTDRSDEAADRGSSLPSYHSRGGRSRDQLASDFYIPVLPRTRPISPVVSYAARRRGLSSDSSSEEDGSNTQYLQDNQKETDEAITKRLLRSYTNPDATIPVIVKLEEEKKEVIYQPPPQLSPSSSPSPPPQLTGMDQGSYTKPDANLPVIEEELSYPPPPQPTGMDQGFIIFSEEPSEISMPTSADNNGDTAAKTKERNQLAGADSSKGSISADTPAGLETAKHVRMKAEVEVIPDERFIGKKDNL